MLTVFVKKLNNNIQGRTQVITARLIRYLPALY